MQWSQIISGLLGILQYTLILLGCLLCIQKSFSDLVEDHPGMCIIMMLLFLNNILILHARV